MSAPIIVTVLVENSVNARGLLAEHGLAVHLQVGRRGVLFDTGQSGLVLENAGKLRVPLEELEAVVLSHGHNDHTGGLKAVRAIAPQARVFLHPASLLPKFAGNADGTGRAIGMEAASAAAIRYLGERVAWTNQPTEIMEGIFVTGEIPRTNDFEDTGGRFFLDPACTQPDPLPDDQALFFDSADGLVVLLGCAHSGVVNTLGHIRHLTSGRPIHTVLGGMHLLAATPERIEKTIDAFRRLDVQHLGPAHCTGLSAIARLWTAFPARCVLCAVGTRLSLLR